MYIYIYIIYTYTCNTYIHTDPLLQSTDHTISVEDFERSGTFWRLPPRWLERWVPDFGYGSDNPISVLQLADSSDFTYVKPKSIQNNGLSGFLWRCWAMISSA